MNTRIDINRKHALWLMLAVLLLASGLRMIALETTPPGFYVDEAIESYDAYALWHTGRDHHGARFPITPGGVNDYRSQLCSRPARNNTRCHLTRSDCAAYNGHAPLSPRIDLQGPLTFVGLALYTDEMGTAVESWWEVTATPITRPLSLMAHWVTAEGKALAIADGLGVAPSLLQSGDMIVQRHRFANLWPTAEHWLRIGAYWLDTMERWPVASAGEADAIFIRVERPSTP